MTPLWLLADPEPPEVREVMVEVFRRPEFQRSKGLLQRFLDWVAEQLGSGQPGEMDVSGWGGPIGEIIGWVVLTLLAVALVVVVVLVIRRWRPVGRRARTPDVDITIEDHRTAAEWGSAARQFEAAGNWKEAVRCRYRELVCELVDRGHAMPMPGRTTGELRADVAAGLAPVAAEFSEATDLFELPWYADRPTGAEENARFRQLASAVTAVSARTAPGPHGANTAIDPALSAPAGADPADADLAEAVR